MPSNPNPKTWGCSERPNPNVRLQRSLWKHQQQRNRNVVQQHHHRCVEITAGGRQCCRDDHQLWPTLHGQCIQHCRRKLQSLPRDKHPPALFPVPMGMGSNRKTVRISTNDGHFHNIILFSHCHAGDTKERENPWHLSTTLKEATQALIYEQYEHVPCTILWHPCAYIIIWYWLEETYKKSHVPVAKRHFYLLTSNYSNDSPSFPDMLRQYTVEIFLQWKETRKQNSAAVHYHKGKQLLRHKFSINMLLSVKLVISNIKGIMVRKPHGNKIWLVCCLLCISFECEESNGLKTERLQGII